MCEEESSKCKAFVVVFSCVHYGNMEDSALAACNVHP